MTNRRKVLFALGSTFATPFLSIAQQQTKIWRIGYLSGISRPAVVESGSRAAFMQAIRELGYAEGRNLAMEWRFAEGSNERLSGHAAELVQLKVDVIVTVSTPTTLAAQKATTAIPIVIGGGSDPVANGLIKSLARPGGNITGITNLSADLSLKQFDLLLAMLPKLSRLGVLLNSDNTASIKILESIEAEAHKRGVKTLPAKVRTLQEIDQVLSLMRKQNAGAVIVVPDNLFSQRVNQIGELTVRHRLPSVAQTREFADAGVLMTYGPNILDQYRRVAIYVDKILKGAKPADLPVEQPTTFELIINGKTAKALGLTIPPSLMISANKVIE